MKRFSRLLAAAALAPPAALISPGNPGGGAGADVHGFDG